MANHPLTTPRDLCAQWEARVDETNISRNKKCPATSAGRNDTVGCFLGGAQASKAAADRWSREGQASWLGHQRCSQHPGGRARQDQRLLLKKQYLNSLKPYPGNRERAQFPGGNR
ncbi:hypothetical protein PtrM4_085790 [Pyrenophora tritici-repentis]|uniref:Uncharacterized protein n=1 Tax=Pyrenophora tritici-repentis TaxID=45151 RepID=A0A834S180_9PLEO|nr:hypothetical protein PtrM4_085790 [Pyrenophora tritici-repentis]